MTAPDRKEPKAGHTPGPWRPVRDAQGICGLMHPTLDGVAVAWLSDTHRPAKGYVGDGVGMPEREANAALIASAPALAAEVEALRGTVRSLLTMHIAHHNSQEHVTARAALKDKP